MLQHNKKKIVVFIQARMGSTRLPAKIMKMVLGRPILLHQINRIRQARTVDEVVVVTSNNSENNVIENLCKKNDILCFRGSESDLLDRHYQAAKKYQADFIVKIPSDCPLADPKIIDEVLNLWINNQNNYDYVSNYHNPTFPDGLDVEGCPFSILEIAWKEAKKDYEREHTFPYIWDNPQRFRIGNVKNKLGNMFMTHRWTLDYEEDFEFLKIILENFKDQPNFSMKDVLEFLKNNPSVEKINKKYAGVNWYRKNKDQLNTINRYEYKQENDKLKLDNSLTLLDRAKKVIPCATQTLSKGYTQWSVGASPLFLESARGCEVKDVDENTYIDYGMALGPFILGYNDSDINQAIKNQLKKGTMFTLPTELEVEAAELIIENVPCAEMVRFGKNGSDATTAAVKLARAYTGKEKIITCGYHGWHDWYIATTERDLGIPKMMKELVLSMEYNNINSLEKILDEYANEIAGLIMEPVYVIEPENNFLEQVRELTKKYSIVLIFDELFTGFRWSIGGAQQFFKVTPDLACFGKAMANGMPISCVAGKKEIMEKFEEVFFSFTYGGEALSLAATVATIKKLKTSNVYDHIWKTGGYLKDNFNNLVNKYKLNNYLSIMGYPFKTAISFKGTDDIDPLEMKTYWQQECAKKGVLFIGYHLCSYAHTKEHIDFTLRAYEEIMPKFKELVEQNKLKEVLQGSVLTQIFKNVGDRSAGIEDKK